MSLVFVSLFEMPYSLPSDTRSVDPLHHHAQLGGNTSNRLRLSSASCHRSCVPFATAMA